MPSAKYEIKRKCEECGAIFIALKSAIDVGEGNF